MGITQHISGTDNVKSLANLAMLCGNVGVEGGGVNPLRGQNNVQGACDMGGLPNVYTGYQRVTDLAVRERMAKAWGVARFRTKPGLDGDGDDERPHPRARSRPSTSSVRTPWSPTLISIMPEKSLKKLDFLVVQDIFLTETAELAHVVLPSASFAEKEGTFTNTERKVQRVRKAVDRPGEAREDWEIISELSDPDGLSHGL